MDANSRKKSRVWQNMPPHRADVMVIHTVLRDCIPTLPHLCIADAELVVFDDCAHSPNIEEPARFNTLLLDFVRGTRDREAPRRAANV